MNELYDPVAGRLFLFGDRASRNILLRMTDKREISDLHSEYDLIRERADTEDFLLCAAVVSDWNGDLSPWEAPPVFGNDGFGGRANETLLRLRESVIPSLLNGRAADEVSFTVGGYSLAGLFALWAACETELFSAVAAASPSVWFPGFGEYFRNKTLHTEKLYLSLGDREERTKNPVMCRVGDCIRDIYAQAAGRGVHSVLEWNKGGHFDEPTLRTAKAFAWTLKNRE